MENLGGVLLLLLPCGGAWIFEALGGNPSSWVYFQGGSGETLAKGFAAHTGSIMNLGIIVGALLASLLASEFRIKKDKVW